MCPFCLTFAFAVIIKHLRSLIKYSTAGFILFYFKTDISNYLNGRFWSDFLLLFGNKTITKAEVITTGSKLSTSVVCPGIPSLITSGTSDILVLSKTFPPYYNFFKIIFYIDTSLSSHSPIFLNQIKSEVLSASCLRQRTNLKR